MRWVIVGMMAGCWATPSAATQTTPNITIGGAPDPQADPPRPAVTVTRVSPVRPTIAPLHRRGQPVGFPRHSVWSGTYTCSQGLTGVTLSIDVDGTEAAAVFEFSAVPSNPSVPTGSSRMKGTVTETLQGTAAVDLVPDAWISQPPGWFLVGVDATTDDAMTEMHGKINSSTCGDIDLKRGP